MAVTLFGDTVFESTVAATIFGGGGGVTVFGDNMAASISGSTMWGHCGCRYI